MEGDLEVADVTASQDVLTLILEYAIKHRQHTLTQAALKQTSSGIKLPDIFIVISVLDKIFATRNIAQFELVARLVENVYDIDNRICTFKLVSKLLLGLKMKFLLEYLRQNDRAVRTKLDKHLPRTRSHFNDMVSKEYLDYENSVISFRDFFIPLVYDKVARDKYFSEEYELEYGEECMSCLIKLMNSFLEELTYHLPQTKLETLFSRKYELTDIHGNQDLQRLLEFLRGIMILTEEDLIRFLDILEKETDGNSGIVIPNINDKRLPEADIEENEDYTDYLELINDSDLIDTASESEKTDSQLATEMELKTDVNRKRRKCVKNDEFNKIFGKSSYEIVCEKEEFTGNTGESLTIRNEKQNKNVTESFNCPNSQLNETTKKTRKEVETTVYKSKNRFDNDSKVRLRLKEMLKNHNKNIEEESDLLWCNEPRQLRNTYEDAIECQRQCIGQENTPDERTKRVTGSRLNRVSPINREQPDTRHTLSPVYPDNADHFLCRDVFNLEVDDDLDDDLEEFDVVPPSDIDPGNEIELDDFEDETEFDDSGLPDSCIPTFENFRVISPVKLCVVKLFGKKGGIYS